MSILLPETLGLPLPQTFEDSENIANDRPFFGLVHHWNLSDYKTIISSQDFKKKENENESEENEKL